MTDREKLTNIVCDVMRQNRFAHCNYPPCFPVKAIVDALIANSVTMQQWRDAKTDPPEEKKPVQCFFVNCQCVGFWTKEKGYKQWFASVGDLYFECESEPDYWMPLPEPPKSKSDCKTCEHSYWHDPECSDCNVKNGFKYYTPRGNDHV